MSIIIPGQADPNDPMVQKAMQVDAEQAKMMAIVEGIRNQLFVSVYSQMAVEHKLSGEELSLDSGRELAEAAANLATDIVQQYSPFLFEKMGLAKLDRKEPAE